jgi:hypothetical protein
VDLRAIRIKHIKVDGAEDKLKQLEQDLHKNYDVSAFTVKLAARAVLTVTGEESMNKWKEIESKVAALNGPKKATKDTKEKGGKDANSAKVQDPKGAKANANTEENVQVCGRASNKKKVNGNIKMQGIKITHNMSDNVPRFKQLVLHTLRKKTIDLAQFKQQHNLMKKPFLDKRTSQVIFIVRDRSEQARIGKCIMYCLFFFFFGFFFFFFVYLFFCFLLTSVLAGRWMSYYLRQSPGTRIRRKRTSQAVTTSSGWTTTIYSPHLGLAHPLPPSLILPSFPLSILSLPLCAGILTWACTSSKCAPNNALQSRVLCKYLRNCSICLNKKNNFIIINLLFSFDRYL